MQFSTRLKSLRMSRGLNQKEFAAVLGISPVTLSHYENGKREPDLDTLCALCGIIQVSSDYLLGLSDNPMPSASLRLTCATIPRDPYADLTPEHRAILDGVADTLRRQEQSAAPEAKKG